MRHEAREAESPWVMVARYSEIGFMIPAAVLVGYLLGLDGGSLSAYPLALSVGIIFGAVAGFVSMIRKALESSKEEEKQDGDGSHDGQ